MNNYLAKPVRAHVLKQMLEGYLNQVPKAIPNLQKEARNLSQEVLDKAAMYNTERPTAGPVQPPDGDEPTPATSAIHLPTRGK